MSTLAFPWSITSCLCSCRSLLTGDLSPTLFPTSYSSHSRQRDLIESWIRLCPPSAQKHLMASHFILWKIQNPIQILTSMTLHKWIPLLPQSTHTHTLFRIPPQFTHSSPTARAPSLMSSSNWGGFTSFPVWIPFISSFGLTKTSTTVLSRSASRHSSLAPDVLGKISHLSALSMMLAVGFCRCPSSGWRSSLLFLVCWGLSSWKNVGFFSMLFLQLLR